MTRLALVLLMLVVAGCAAAPARVAPADAETVLVARRGWHIDVGLPAEELSGALGFVRSQFPGARYVFFGFGDERYVRSAHHRIPALLGAIWPGRGVMLVTAIDNAPDEAFGTEATRRVPLTRGQLQSLQDFIGRSFEPSENGEPLHAGPYADSLYYRATPRYSGLHTCNTWAAEALRSAGLPVSSRGVLLAGQLWRQVRPLQAGPP